jgi:Ribbon-helix-helix protein, copG family
MPSTRYTVRLPPALDAAVQEHIRTAGTPFAVLLRDALSAYLADTPPTGSPTPADSADTFREIQDELAALRARVEILELALTAVPTPRRQVADSTADTAPTAADTPAVPRQGRRPGPLHQQILALLRTHPEGLRAEELRVYLQARRPIGDTLQGMRKGGVILTRGRGPARRYVVAE